MTISVSSLIKSTVVTTLAMLGNGAAAARPIQPKSLGDGFGAQDALSLQPRRALQGQINPFVLGPTPPPPAVVLPSVDVPADFAGPGAVVPDNRHYGACETPIATSLADVDTLFQDGGKFFVWDVYRSNMSQTAAQNTTFLTDLQQVANFAGARNMGVIFSLSKDDVTMKQLAPATNRKPTQAAIKEVALWANQFKTATNVNVGLGGQPHNYDGSETQAILASYANATATVAATGYKSTLWFVGPEKDGRTGLETLVPNAAQFNAAKVKFMLFPYGSPTEVQQYLAPCKTLGCLSISGVEVNATLDINNPATHVGFEIGLASGLNIKTAVTPWAGNEIKSDEGEEVLRLGNVCTDTTRPSGFSTTGQQLWNVELGA